MERPAPGAATKTQNVALEITRIVEMWDPSKRENYAGAAIGRDILTGETKRIELMTAEQAASVIPSKKDGYEDRLLRHGAAFSNRPTLDSYGIGSVVAFEQVYQEDDGNLLARWPSVLKTPDAPHEAVQFGVLQAVVISAKSSGVYARVNLHDVDRAVALDPSNRASIEAVFDPANIDGMVADRKFMVVLEDSRGQVRTYSLPQLRWTDTEGVTRDPAGDAAREAFGVSVRGGSVTVTPGHTEYRAACRQTMAAFVFDQVHGAEGLFAAAAIAATMSSRKVDDVLERIQTRDDMDPSIRDSARQIMEMVRERDVRAAVVPGASFVAYRSVATRLTESRNDRGLTEKHRWFHGFIGISSGYVRDGEFQRNATPHIHRVVPEDPGVRRMNTPAGKDRGLTIEDLSAMVISSLEKRDSNFAHFFDPPPAAPPSSGMGMK